MFSSLISKKCQYMMMLAVNVLSFKCTVRSTLPTDLYKHNKQLSKYSISANTTWAQ